VNNMASTGAQAPINNRIEHLLLGLKSVADRSADLAQADEVATLTGSYQSISSMGGMILSPEELAALNGSQSILRSMLESLAKPM
jgi:hypothetical protein